MAALFHGKSLKAVAEAVRFRVAGMQAGDGNDDLHDALSIADELLSGRRRGSVLVEMTPAEAAGLLAHTKESICDSATERALAALETVAACGGKRRG